MSILIPLAAGGIAGISVDMLFFPIDTIKTRLQAPQGLAANGGLRNMYKGIGSTITASAPGAALFFVTYEQTKKALKFPNHENLTHMTAAILGETAACTVRVPSEIIKQRVQTHQFSSSLQALKHLISNSPINTFRNMYRGFGITLMREIPFTAIQFPLYEKLKTMTNSHKHPQNSVLCGCVAGGVAAAATTPLDVIKTRMMLLRNDQVSTSQMIKLIAKEKNFFKGILPRTMWISAGGAVFLGMYEISKSGLTSLIQ